MSRHYQLPAVSSIASVRRTFREVATRYFPKVIPEVASRKLRLLIREDPYISQDLYSEGYRPHQHYLTLRQLHYIELHLGTPEEFLSYY